MKMHQGSTIKGQASTSTIMQDEMSKEALIRAQGAGPFRTLRHFSSDSGLRIWKARDHRKGLGNTSAPKTVFQSLLFNLLIGSGFAIGALLFSVGAGLSLAPSYAQVLSVTQNQINLVFLVGSVFFTCAAYLQLIQSANAPPLSKTTEPSRSLVLIGWRPDDPGWLSSITQFAGTLLFNVNTFDAWLGGGGWLRQDSLIWAPDLVGSVLFLIAGYLALVETCHNWWSWEPGSLAWWIVMINFVGCVAFMISAIFAFVPPTGPSATIIALSTGFTLVGSLGFLIGAALSGPESLAAAH